MQPAAVFDTRIILKGSTPVPQVLVSWMGLDNADATWEDKADMEFNYPNFNLEDKVVFDGGGIARLPICEEGPQHAESENVAAQERIKVVSDPEIMEARRGQRIKYPNTRLTRYKTN